MNVEQINDEETVVLPDLDGSGRTLSLVEAGFDHVDGVDIEVDVPLLPVDPSDIDFHVADGAVESAVDFDHGMETKVVLPTKELREFFRAPHDIIVVEGRHDPELAEVQRHEGFLLRVYVVIIIEHVPIMNRGFSFFRHGVLLV